MFSGKAEPTPRHRLRAETRAAHEQVDRAFGRFVLCERQGYAAFLAAHARAFLPVETALDRYGAASLLDDWPLRRRNAALRSDLAALGHSVPEGAPFRIDDDAVAWGALYVLEGSRLGGAMLAQGVPADLPQRFIAGPQPPGAWRSFVARLDLALDQYADCATAVEAAKGVFARFQSAADDTEGPLG